jgi:predicted  nucleic acid-binding Zn-ribbon protein
MFGLGLLPMIGIGAIVLALLGGGEAYRVHNVKQDTWKEATAAQRDVDAKEIASLNMRVGQLQSQFATSQSETKACTDAADAQNKGVSSIAKQRDAVQAELAALRQRQRIDEAKAQGEIDRLRRIAAQPPPPRDNSVQTLQQQLAACTDQLGKVDAILGKGLRDRRAP